MNKLIVFSETVCHGNGRRPIGSGYNHYAELKSQKKTAHIVPEEHQNLPEEATLAIGTTKECLAVGRELFGTSTF